MSTIEPLTAPLRIVSGEGAMGTIKPYLGARTLRAIRSRITRERCGGQRWARIEAYIHTNASGEVWVDVLTGQPL